MNLLTHGANGRVPIATHTLRASALCAVLVVTGCTRVVETFPQRTADEVWIAMQAVAYEPQYPDWFVIENAVFVDDQGRRIEIYRELRRDLARPSTRVQREDRTWRFRVNFDRDDPPTVRFTSRGWAVPSHAYSEAERFFVDVAELLSGMEPSVLRDLTDAPVATEEVETPVPPEPVRSDPARVPPPPIDIDLD